MWGKTKRLLLSFREKYEIIKEVKTDVSKESTLWKYRITETNEPEVSEKVKNCELKKKKSSKTSINIHLNAAAITWFKEARDRGDQIQADQSRKRSKQNFCVTVKLPAPKKF